MTNLPWFPTKYSVSPGIKKLGGEKHFIIDDLLPLYKNEKQDARAENISEYYLEEQNQTNLMKVICFWMAEQLSKEYKHISFYNEDDYYILDNEITGETVYTDESLNVLQVTKSPLCSCSKSCSGCKYPNPLYTNLFDALCSQIQEDVCVMQNDKLVSAHVCLPSWWSPKEKMMMSMAEIHKDVPGMEKTAYEHIWKACLHKAPFIRYNWTLTNSPVLNQHPTKNIGKDFDQDSLYLRVERQVLKGFSNVQGVLFLIRTYVADVNTLKKSQRKAIANAIEGMTDQELEYKGLTNHKEKVILLCGN
tara:strand:- start:298 stop:1212 length:915 start_codon:yes stop_codon:yes gene_type:complete